MNKIFSALALATAVAPFTAQAASVDLTVTGTVIPTACIPAFASGTNVDLGRIYSAALDPIAQNDLPPRDITLKVACDAPAAVEIAVAIKSAAVQHLPPAN